MGEMGKDRRYTVHFLVARDGEEYSALCYEFTTAGSGPDVRSALQDAVVCTVEYLQHLIREGREAEAYRPAPVELVLEFMDLPVDEGVGAEQLREALERAIVAPRVVERAVVIEYDIANGELSPDLQFPPLADTQEALATYPAELVLAGA